MSNNSRIILDEKKLKSTIAALKKAHKKIVLTQGVFDMVHIGHARYLESAHKEGDVLIVGVDSDEKVRHRKGPDRPVVPEAERLEMLTYLASVDYVYLKQLNAPKQYLLQLVRPDVLVATQEIHEKYTEDQLADINKYCGKLVVMEPQATTSTSAKLRLLQIGAAKKISATMSAKLIHAIEEVLAELKGD